MSPDGASVYVASENSDAAAIFDRNTSTGALTQKAGTAGCVSETGTAGACQDGVALDLANGVAVRNRLQPRDGPGQIHQHERAELPHQSEPTTLFDIDRDESELVRQGSVGGTPMSANGGSITEIGPLGFTLSAASDGGFDIAPDGIAYAALTAEADGLTRLYTVDLATGAGSPVGLVDQGTSEVRSMTILREFPPQVLPGVASIAESSVKLKKKAFPLEISCLAGAAACNGAVNVDTAKPVSLAAQSERKKAIVALGGSVLSIPAGQTQTVEVTLTKQGRKLFKQLPKVKAHATITTQAVGGTSSIEADLKIKKKKKK